MMLSRGSDPIARNLLTCFDYYKFALHFYVSTFVLMECMHTALSSGNAPVVAEYMQVAAITQKIMKQQTSILHLQDKLSWCARLLGPSNMLFKHCRWSTVAQPGFNRGLVIPQPAEGQHAGWISLEESVGQVGPWRIVR
jgi:hypothetical protein